MGKWDAEIKRKAVQGIALTNPTAEKQALYDQTRSKIENEIKRKANEGIALTNQTSDVNNQLYNSYAKSKQPTTVAQTQTNSAQSYIDQLNEARKQAALAGLDKSRQQSLSNLQEEKAQIQPRYYDARNQTASSNQQQARNFAEFMASRGGLSSGANAQAEISRQGVFQGNIGSLNRQENQAYDNIDRRTTDVNNAYESDVASANAGIEAERMQALINQMNADRQFGLQEGGLTGIYNGQQTLAAQGQQFNQNMAQNQFDLQRDSQEFNQNMAQEEFAYRQARDQISDQRWKVQFDEDVKRWGIQQALDRQIRQGQLSQGWANYNLSKQRLDYQKEQDQLASQQETVEERISSSDYKNYIDAIESSNYISSDYEGNRSVTDEYNLRKYIISLDLPDQDTVSLLNRYRLPIKENYTQSR